jgi:hypothetical protein
MTRRILAVAGTLALGIVALFTLFNALKAVLGLAVIAFVGRGLMRLWHSGAHSMHGHRHHRFNHWRNAMMQRDHDRHDAPEANAWSGVQPRYQNRREAETVVPIW